MKGRVFARAAEGKALLALSLMVIGAAVWLARADATLFWPYFHAVDPVLATTGAVVCCAFCLVFLRSRGWFALAPQEAGREAIRTSVLGASAFGGIAILADLAGAFPADINVGLPESLLFYPLMGFVVESFFHVAPLTLLFVLTFSLVPSKHRERAAWAALAVVALIEPAFQVSVAPPEPAWVRDFLLPHLVLFNVVQLWLFKRYGFLTMYFFRVVFYLEWHIVWGFARLL